MCYYHPTSLLYAPSIPHQYFVRPCRQAKFYATKLAYPVSSGASGFSNTVSMYSTHGILVRPCSNHYIADEVGGIADAGSECESRSEDDGEDDGEGEGKGEGEGEGDCDVDICMDVPFDFDFDPDEDGDDEEEEESEEDEDDEYDDDSEEDEDDDDMENSNTSTGLAISVPITSIQPSSGPSLKNIKPKPRSKRFKRDLISMPVQLLRMKWKKSMALRYLQKTAADSTVASLSAPTGPHRRIFNNDGFGSWYAPIPVQTRTQGRTQEQEQTESPKSGSMYNLWDGRPFQHYQASGGFS